MTVSAPSHWLERGLSAVTRISDSTQIVHVSLGSVKKMSLLSMFPIWPFLPLPPHPAGTQNKQLDEEEGHQGPETSLIIWWPG